MARIDNIKSEIELDPAKGLNNVQAGYLSTNTVNQNLALINTPLVERYRESVPSNEIKAAFVPSELTSLVTQDRADFGEFVTQLYLHDPSVKSPETNLKSLINSIVGGVSATNYESVIRETVSPGQFLNLGAIDYSEMEEAMNQLGWL